MGDFNHCNYNLWVYHWRFSSVEVRRQSGFLERILEKPKNTTTLSIMSAAHVYIHNIHECFFLFLRLCELIIIYVLKIGKKTHLGALNVLVRPLPYSDHEADESPTLLFYYRYMIIYYTSSKSCRSIKSQVRSRYFFFFCRPSTGWLCT